MPSYVAAQPGATVRKDDGQLVWLGGGAPLPDYVTGAQLDELITNGRVVDGAFPLIDPTPTPDSGATGTSVTFVAGADDARPDGAACVIWGESDPVNGQAGTDFAPDGDGVLTLIPVPAAGASPLPDPDGYATGRTDGYYGGLITIPGVNPFPAGWYGMSSDTPATYEAADDFGVNVLHPGDDAAPGTYVIYTYSADMSAPTVPWPAEFAQ